MSDEARRVRRILWIVMASDADEAGPDRIRKAWRAMISASVVE